MLSATLTEILGGGLALNNVDGARAQAVEDWDVLRHDTWKEQQRTRCQEGETNVSMSRAAGAGPWLRDRGRPAEARGRGRAWRCYRTASAKRPTEVAAEARDIDAGHIDGVVVRLWGEVVKADAMIGEESQFSVTEGTRRGSGW